MTDSSVTLKNQDQFSSYLFLDWVNKPENVQACSTLISGGASTGDYAEYNLATHVGDDLSIVKTNRAKLVSDLGLSGEPVWLEQIHSNKVFLVDDQLASASSSIKSMPSAPQADASVTSNKGTACVVLTADCLPVFFCNLSGTEVAVAHAGWRGLQAGIISNTIKTMKSSADELVVSFGPAIGPQAFEVGEEVRQVFVDKNRESKQAFREAKKGHYFCDIYQLARIELQSAGVAPERIAGGDYCTYSETNRFYSFRRRQNTGRMANLIWLT
ncbi:MAG: peptidoglycan editing factor PgeF [Gammaproteobacteria bacterium]